MLPCSFYTQNSKIDNFKCPFENINKRLKNNPKLHTSINKYCEKSFDCAKNTKTAFRKLKKQNTIINNFSKNQIEIIKYKKDFLCTEDSCNLKGKKNARKFIVEDGILIPKNDSATIDALQQSINDGSKRAQDNYYGYALTNEWQYFLTLTFSSYLVKDRYNDNLVKHLWKQFRENMQYLDKDVKILNVPERHADGAMHFHCLMTLNFDFPIVNYDIDISNFNTFAKNGDFSYLPKTKHKYFLVPYILKGVHQKSRSGALLYSMSFCNYGLNTLAILPKEQNQMAVINYLITYTTKQANIGYNKKRYYRTNNLNFKNKLICNYDDDTIGDIVKDYNYKLYKDNDKFTVYRNFNIKE